MSIEQAARLYEREAQVDPAAAAADMKFLSQATQQRILDQMQKDANDANNMAKLSVERDRSGNITAIHFDPIFENAGNAGAADRKASRY